MANSSTAGIPEDLARALVPGGFDRWLAQNPGEGGLFLEDEAIHGYEEALALLPRVTDPGARNYFKRRIETQGSNITKIQRGLALDRIYRLNAYDPVLLELGTIIRALRCLG